MIAPYDHEALWIKAKLFLNRAMDGDGVRSFDEQALWASLALELLAKAALARISPVLIAEPTEEGTNVLAALGLTKGGGHFSSVRAKTVLTRCSRAFRPFDLKESSRFTEARNEYLHGPGVAFLGIPPKVWWPKFWAQVAILVDNMDKEISDLVGSDREAVVDGYLAQNKKNIEDRTEALIARAQQRLAQHRAGTMTKRMLTEWNSVGDLTAFLSYQAPQQCPACDQEGLLEGDEELDRELEETVSTGESADDGAEFDFDFDYPTFTVTIAADYFSCPHCHLVLNRYELVEQAGLPTSFEVEGIEGDTEYDGPDYGND
ncbi:hypothetical protein [Herbidospora cretacea]|uniref:hypothetical protein n=1 Tax=Herbidospora cretacea TaxID=28444 RepID=UPI000774534C|nr:hypothetical protein [Herbidospora cretacea]